MTELISDADKGMPFLLSSVGRMLCDRYVCHDNIWYEQIELEHLIVDLYPAPGGNVTETHEKLLIYLKFKNVHCNCICDLLKPVLYWICVWVWQMVPFTKKTKCAFIIN